MTGGVPQRRAARDGLRAGTGPRAGRAAPSRARASALDLVGPEHLVDEPGGLRLRGAEQPLVHERAHPLRREPTRGRDVGDEPAEEVVEQRVVRLARRRATGPRGRAARARSCTRPRRPPRRRPRRARARRAGTGSRSRARSPRARSPAASRSRSPRWRASTPACRRRSGTRGPACGRGSARAPRAAPRSARRRAGDRRCAPRPPRPRRRSASASSRRRSRPYGSGSPRSRNGIRSGSSSRATSMVGARRPGRGRGGSAPTRCARRRASRSARASRRRRR